MCTSLRMDPYMRVTAHFIDEDWKGKSLVLREKKEVRTQEEPSLRDYEVGDAFKVPAGKVSVVVNNVVNMKLCVGTLKESHEFPGSNVFLDIQCQRASQLCMH